MSALADADLREAFAIKYDFDYFGRPTQITTCENCAAAVCLARIRLRLEPPDPWREVWWEVRALWPHTVERCRAARSERRSAANDPAPG